MQFDNGAIEQTEKQLQQMAHCIISNATESALQLGGTTAQHIYCAVEVHCANVACTARTEAWLLATLTRLGFPF